jgi:DNA-binding GntR family transcriptional regulator
MTDLQVPASATAGSAKPSGTNRRPAESVTRQTYQALLEMIASRQLEPGDLIEERKLAERFEVSRTPMRAAISRLLGEGILQQLPNGLLVVREVGITEYLELLSIRLLLESEAAALAAPHAPMATLNEIERRLQEVLGRTAEQNEDFFLDDDIHVLVLTHCGNQSLSHFIREIHKRIRMRNLARVPGRFLPACHEHLALVAALKARDPEQARQAMLAHLNNVRASFLESVGIRA